MGAPPAADRPVLPPSSLELAPFIKRADEIHAHNPLMAYYCASVRALCSRTAPPPSSILFNARCAKNFPWTSSSP